MRVAGTPPTEETVVPHGIQVGLGVRTAGTQKLYEQGAFKSTGNQLDIALSGNGFFKLTDLDGQEVFTRDGAFKIDSNREILNANGLRFDPPLVVPEGLRVDKIAIDTLGRVSSVTIDTEEPVEFGQILTNRFINPAGLMSLGDNLYRATEASGVAVEGNPGLLGQPQTIQGFLEMSNVKAVDEMVNMITAQRAYEFNSKTIQTSDSILQTAIALKQ
ncbi:hypothetical protein KUTeg_015677 [Tegillarca granosa]|uniref:Flagellar basal-body rod protein FlgG n=1 Tax=Tegillarca granosa TaxID=220873 RepID=A0ABQ9ENI8_TEGGR|nr:hypothetical protein KUTeg_015677 [Tegillarca granosa]